MFSKNLPGMSVARVNKHYSPMFRRFKAINLFWIYLNCLCCVLGPGWVEKWQPEEDCCQRVVSCPVRVPGVTLRTGAPLLVGLSCWLLGYILKAHYAFSFFMFKPTKVYIFSWHENFGALMKESNQQLIHPTSGTLQNPWTFESTIRWIYSFPN